MLFKRLKIILIFGLIILNLQPVISQDFLEEFESLITEEKIKLLPEKMIFTQKIFWGENGLFRKTGISKLSLENREKELVLREKMLKAHQILGYVFEKDYKHLILGCNFRMSIKSFLKLIFTWENRNRILGCICEQNSIKIQCASGGIDAERFDPLFA